MRFRPVIALILLAGVLLLGGCVNIDILNLSDSTIRVLIRTPDSGTGTTRLIPPAGSGGTFSTHGGGYRISVLPNEEYQQLLLSLQQQITTRLFEEGGSLSSGDVAQLMSRLNEIDGMLDDLARPQPFCAGTAPDWSTVTGILNYDFAAQQYTIDCSLIVNE